jgi:hypothetical protein
MAVLTPSGAQTCAICLKRHSFALAVPLSVGTPFGGFTQGYDLSCGCRIETPPWKVRFDSYSTGNSDDAVHRVTIIPPSGDVFAGTYTRDQILSAATKGHLWPPHNG